MGNRISTGSSTLSTPSLLEAVLPSTSIPPSSIAGILDKVKTPFYYYDARIVRSRYRGLRGALPSDWKIFFAAKANPNVAILEIYRKLGAMAECASAGEIEACLKAGFAPKKLALSGPVKTGAELRAIKKNPPFIVHAETPEELRELKELKAPLKIALRVNLDIGIKKDAGNVMIGGKEKFGFLSKDIGGFLENSGGVNVCGFHMYMGTQILSSRVWLKGAERFLDWVLETCRKSGFNPSYINLGGGAGAPYGGNDSEFDLQKFKTGLARIEKKFSKEPELLDAVFYIEPGRYLAAPTGVYVMKVVAIKKMRGVNFALTDGGIHHALFPFRVSRSFPARLINRKGGKLSKKYILGGPLCTSLDQSDLPVTLPELRAGDVIGIYQSGSYGYTAGMHYFLSHPMPGEVLKDGKNLYLIRKPSASKHFFDLQTKKSL
ncbi:MAG: hypothetical protein V3S46_03410 [Nitrospinota bacterium]